MKRNSSSLPGSLVGMLGRSSLSDEDRERLRHQAWWEQGLLIVHPWDARLSSNETWLLNQIAEKLYGGSKP